VTICVAYRFRDTGCSKRSRTARQGHTTDIIVEIAVPTRESAPHDRLSNFWSIFSPMKNQ
ncbi:MAG: hypothetical protein ABI304_05155, partial [Rudaea sp.]